LSAPTTTPSRRSLHPDASIRMVFPGRKQSIAKLNHRVCEICEHLFLYLLFIWGFLINHLVKPTELLERK
jgi:hypothetical protein